MASMSDDERAIRELVSTWMSASKAGDTATVLSLMTDDVVFMTVGGPPFGKEAFARNSEGMKGVEVDGSAEVLEVQVAGDWAWQRCMVRVTITPPGKPAVTRSGLTLTVLRKNAAGKWQIARDANFVK